MTETINWVDVAERLQNELEEVKCERDRYKAELESLRAKVATRPKQKPSDKTPILLTFPCIGPVPEWNLHQSFVDTYEQLYDGLDVFREAKKALAWVLSNAANRKTAKGMPRFLNNWFSRGITKRSAIMKGTGCDEANGWTNESIAEMERQYQATP